MKLYPVVMCGGSGTRLWPASRPSRPKQFIPLSGNRSLFQETVLRVAPLTEGGGQTIVVGGIGHRQAIVSQLAEIGVTAQILLEPAARDSAAAMAAAAAWTANVDPEGINVFVASDHHIPDYGAFQHAVRAAVGAAANGRIVTLGVHPTHPSSAYGYISPSGPGLADVLAFVEKPDENTAAHYIETGHLWNSGNFIVSASVLLDELRAEAPLIAEAACAAVGPADRDGVMTLSDDFLSAPKVSIDYAVMEKTRRASVLAVDFHWSDLGAWDAVAATGDGDLGLYLFEDAEGCMARACEGVMVAAIGVRNLAIVVERDAVLVCDLSRSQDVKKIVERMRVASPQHLDFSVSQPESLESGARRFAHWMKMRALPLWGTLGQDDRGAFSEVLAMDGRQIHAPRRARVQARQLQVFGEAGRHGWAGPWRAAVDKGLKILNAEQLRADGLMRAVVSFDGQPLDETAALYDQAFLLFALASTQAGDPARALEAQALVVRNTLLAGRPERGGLLEQGDHPYQSNAHMHLLEASLAWEEVGQDPDWSATTDWVVHVARTFFIDKDGGFLREFFNMDWTPAEGEVGSLVEPGHQFEWAWLLARYGASRGDTEVIDVARRLYVFGQNGIDNQLGVALDSLNDDGSVRTRRARLWPQTEWLKASLILAELSNNEMEKTRYLSDAASAMRALWKYLTPDGLWHDKLLADGTFLDEPAPASSFYHIAAAYGQIVATSRNLGLMGGANLTLG